MQIYDVTYLTSQYLSSRQPMQRNEMIMMKCNNNADILFEFEL